MTLPRSRIAQDALDAARYRTLRAMIGPVQIIIGPQMDLPEHAPSVCDYEQMRADLDAELDRRHAAKL